MSEQLNKNEKYFKIQADIAGGLLAVAGEILTSPGYYSPLLSPEGLSAARKSIKILRKPITDVTKREAEKLLDIKSVLMTVNLVVSSRTPDLKPQDKAWLSRKIVATMRGCSSQFRGSPDRVIEKFLSTSQNTIRLVDILRRPFPS